MWISGRPSCLKRRTACSTLRGVPTRRDFEDSNEGTPCPTVASCSGRAASSRYSAVRPRSANSGRAFKMARASEVALSPESEKCGFAVGCLTYVNGCTGGAAASAHVAKPGLSTSMNCVAAVIARSSGPTLPRCAGFLRQEAGRASAIETGEGRWFMALQLRGTMLACRQRVCTP